MVSMAGPIASVAGCGIFKVRPSTAGASTPRRICSSFAPTVAALRSVGSARGALTVTCAKKKNGGKSAKGVKGKNGAAGAMKKGARSDKALNRSRTPGATNSSGDGVWDSIRVGAEASAENNDGVPGGVDDIIEMESRGSETGIAVEMSFDEEGDDTMRSTPGTGVENDQSSTSSADGLMKSMEPDEQISTPKALMTPKQRIRFALKRVDSDGYWALISSGIVFGTFLLESYNMSKFGGWDVLFREDISFMTGLISTKDLEDIQDAYNILFAIEFVLRAWAADFELKFWKNPLTLVDFAASVPPVLSFFELVSSRDPLLRFLRLLRVVRLLRLLDNRDPDSTLFGLVKSNSMGVQLAGIGFEFVCIFIITAGVVYDLEYATNPNVNDLNDTLYWAILTLTGIGQPFEVVTAGGRVATVMAIGVALVVVPGQLAKLATVAGAQDIIEGFMPDELESYDEDDFESFDEGEGWTSLPIVNGAMAANGGFAKAQTSAMSTPQTASQTSTQTVSAAVQIDGAREDASVVVSGNIPVSGESPGTGLVTAPGGFVPQSGVAMRQKMWDGRECDTCGLQIHEQDARFCRRCGGKLGSTEAAGMLYVKRSELPAEIASKKREAAKRRQEREKQKQMGGFGGGRLGLDIAGSAMRLAQNSRSKSKKKKARGKKGGNRA